eukprot:SAG31_NODE_3115_length_4659_cov_2.837939_6_plen_61_part_00
MELGRAVGDRRGGSAPLARAAQHAAVQRGLSYSPSLRLEATEGDERSTVDCTGGQDGSRA